MSENRGVLQPTKRVAGKEWAHRIAHRARYSTRSSPGKQGRCCKKKERERVQVPQRSTTSTALNTSSVITRALSLLASHVCPAASQFPTQHTAARPSRPLRACPAARPSPGPERNRLPDALVLKATGVALIRRSPGTVLLLSNVLTSGLGFLSALSPNYLCLLVLRFFVGIGVGSGHVFSSWFLEFVPAGKRGTWMVIFSFFWTIGTVLEASLAWAVLSALSWRWLLALTSLPCFLLLPFFRITPESPRYLCAQNKMTDATLVLERMAIANQAALPMGVLTYHQETKADYITHVPEDEDLIPVREKEHTATNAISSKSGAIAALCKLLSHNLLRSTLLLWFVFYASSFAYYGITLLASQLSDVNRSCKSDMIFEVRQNDDNLYKDTFITSLAEIPGLILSALLVDRVGRKATMWCLMFACCAFLGPLALHQNELLTTTLLFGARACGTGTTMILCIYAPEVYPTSVRSTGVGIATAIGKIGGVICPLVAVGMLRSCHQMEAVLVLELVLLLAGVACIFFPVETKGREMD